ncbi:uncharacterized protein LOC128263110 [Drosophila gunungcola]|uniref:MADF domain-containing protein n=1 Tax=Drosophila gunungcola TaxID=103775 RepID=A0A9P9YS73_9MUSC|nr:uncharacterized protein LOC128263110 [Drosophila gunungcola]KAI8042116.1 hypothetical protein M5D96_003418 [Drosophila gunungcola]
MNRKGRPRNSSSTTEYFYFERTPSLGRSRALLVAKLKREEQSKTSFDSSTGYYSYTDGTSLRRTPINFSPSPQLRQSPKVKLKLIALFEDHKCLWNQCDRDFFNFERKEEIWEAIAHEMKPDSPPEFWKHMMHRLRYNVDLKRIQEQGAKLLGETARPKLFYEDKLHFLNRMFHRERKSLPREIFKSPRFTLEKLPSKMLQKVAEKPKTHTPITEKMASFEKLRNHQRSKLVLSREAFQKMQKVTSGGPYYLTNLKTKIKS